MRSADAAHDVDSSKYCFFSFKCANAYEHCVQTRDSLCLTQPLFVFKCAGKNTGDYHLSLNIENSKLAVSPTLLIAVCDRSGSMSGEPWRQVYDALLHIVAISKQNKNIILLSFYTLAPQNLLT